MNDDLLKLENQLCFPLYASSKKIISLYKPFLDAISLTYTQYITMMVLWEHNSISVKDLGKYLYLDSGTLTPLLKRLESKGFVERKRSISDERNVLINITDSGRKLKEKAKQVPQQMSQCISLSNEEIKILYQLLYKILNQK